MARLGEIVIDADHPARLARFWEAVLDDYSIRPYNDAEIAPLASLGLTPGTGPSVLLDGPGPVICFQLMVGPRPARNRIHLDVITADRETEVERLSGPGATHFREAPGYTVLRDPEGNQFCVVGPRRA
ncbi:MAG: VOC family protein [Devosia nanyangense]|uniref:VOC family protein n=1 Tax=Devosia nanyangense TaxID=1228055 RepID=A0A933L6H1_9HYPH|nr:VOC family protein [Devosia nanyangense]